MYWYTFVGVVSGNRIDFGNFPIGIFLLFTHSTNLLSINYVPDIVLGARVRRVNKTESLP